MLTQVLAKKENTRPTPSAWDHIKRVSVALIFAIEVVAAAKVGADALAPNTRGIDDHSDIAVLQSQMADVQQRVQRIDDRTWFILTTILGGLIIQTYFQVKSHYGKKHNDN